MKTYHIICSGEKLITYSKLAAIQIGKHYPPQSGQDFKIFIHLAHIAPGLVEFYTEWLADTPHVEVTVDLVSRNQRISVVTYSFMRQGPLLQGSIAQLAMNNLTKEFAFERFITIVDADCFITGSQWFTSENKYNFDDVYVVSSEFRDDRSSVRLGERLLRSYDTIIYSINTRIHNAIQFQIGDPGDSKALACLANEFPRLRFPADFRCDRGVLESIKAQIYELKVIKSAASESICHVGGVSHFSKTYFQSDRSRLDMWIRRLRLHLNVNKYFETIGWGDYISKSHFEQFHYAFDSLVKDSELYRLFCDLEPSRDEVEFSKIFYDNNI